MDTLHERNDFSRGEVEIKWALSLLERERERGRSRMNGVNSLLLVTRRRGEGERKKKKKRGNVYTILEEQRDSLDSICMRLIGRTSTYQSC